MARNSNDKWTADEDGRLRKLRAAGKSNLQIAAALGRSLNSVVGRLYVLKKKSAGGPIAPADRKRPPWSTADEQRLLEMKGAGASIHEIATVMKRTEAAIDNRLHVLKYRDRRNQRIATS